MRCIPLAIALMGAQPALAADPLCDVLRRLETVAPERVDNPRERRWVEFHWGFDHSGDAVWSWGCRHSGQSIAAVACVWLRDHTNQEFTMMLPQNVMACYGYRFPRSAQYDWAGVAGKITLHGRRGNRLLLDLDYRDLPHGEVAMRLAVEAENGNYEPEELPPIAPMTASKPD